MTVAKEKLPPEVEDNIVEVSMRHVFLAFSGLVTAVFVTGIGIVFARDYAKYKRQKAVIDAATQLLQTIKEGDLPWKEKKKDTSSQIKK
ncbi:MAG: hypothetical protein ISR95_00295 [Candidatus Marinimicrobia bacterium]|nr:hypothetical protein [Candidatus Neomarinimicrobiota bacterium]MBL7046070.1 hypothetical protein [Candidatus Neomarinimicrobiota bacterium]